MKLRTDFVTNSSSSSFIIMKNGLTPQQIEGIENPGPTARKLADRFVRLDLGQDEDPCDSRIVIPEWAETVEDYIDEAGSWHVTDYDDILIKLYTYMDNFDITDLVKLLGIPEGNCQQSYSY